jgi:hypothetical protein
LIVVLSRHSHALRGYYHFHFFATFSLWWKHATPWNQNKTDHLGHNKFSVSVWDVNNITWWRKLKIVRDWWAYLNCSNHVCLKWKLDSTLLAVLTPSNFFPIFNADCCFCLHLGYAEDSTAQNALTYSSQKFQPFNTQE